MNVLSIIMLCFALLGAVDRIFGSRLGLGKEFERGFALFAPMALSMIGMIVIAPAIGVWLGSFFEWFYNVFGLDPSIIPVTIFANDMGGTPLAMAIMKSSEIGMYNALVVASIMGTVISYTLPVAIGIVNKSQHKEMFFGFLCGIVAIPVGCLVSGLVIGISFVPLILNLLPLIIIALIIALGLIFAPTGTVKIFKAFGYIMLALITAGLAMGMFTEVTKIVICEHFASVHDGAKVCFNASITLAGAFPFMFVLTKILEKPLSVLGNKLGINQTSAACLLPNVVTNSTTLVMMYGMDKKGVVLNSALAVTVSFAFGSHLGFTMSYDGAYILPMIVAKLVAGAGAVTLALLIYKDKKALPNIEEALDVKK